MALRRAHLLTAAAVLAVAPLSACGSGSSADEAAASPAPGITRPRTVLSITDPWVKAADSGMSAAFGTLVNTTDKPVTVVSATSSASPVIELHEVVSQDGKAVMRPKKGGFVIPARGSHRLTPGGDHIMLMDVKQKMEPGGQVSFTLRLGDGSTYTFTAVVKHFTGAKETYDPDHHG
ncbi:MAG TPA: copper chaperone PCu(A)C [Thermomonospora sp.]|nr:copper chaperone PCu(A)C [Thermomonospora sp.]